MLVTFGAAQTPCECRKRTAGVGVQTPHPSGCPGASKLETEYMVPPLDASKGLFGYTYLQRSSCTICFLSTLLSHVCGGYGCKKSVAERSLSMCLVVRSPGMG
jgi:hypothetical protein